MKVVCITLAPPAGFDKTEHIKIMVGEIYTVIGDREHEGIEWYQLAEDSGSMYPKCLFGLISELDETVIHSEYILQTT